MASTSRTSGNDNLTSTSGDDTITPGNGNANINGGAGIDTVVFSGRRSNYDITATACGYQVNDTIGGTGGKTVSNVEMLLFSDKVANLVIASDAKKITTEQLNSLAELYIAYFNRPLWGVDPDRQFLAGGLNACAVGELCCSVGV